MCIRDSPYTPASLTQRNGRIIRQGNTNEGVHKYYYAVKGSTDNLRLNMLQNKGNWISDVMNGSSKEITFDEASDMNTVIAFAENPEEAKQLFMQIKKDEEAKARQKQIKDLQNKLYIYKSKSDFSTLQPDFIEKDYSERLSKSLHKITNQEYDELRVARETGSSEEAKEKIKDKWNKAREKRKEEIDAVSYTHLTLPTIYSV